jgi:hypothetical protein
VAGWRNEEVARSLKRELSPAANNGGLEARGGRAELEARALAGGEQRRLGGEPREERRERKVEPRGAAE